VPDSGDSTVEFTCPHCRSRLRAPSTEADTRHRCPACRSVFLVPHESQAAAVEADDGDEYPLCEQMGQPPPTSRLAHQTYVLAVCPVCQARMHATEDQVGRQIVCPDCGVAVVVRPPPAPKRKPSPAVDSSDTYDIRDGDDDVSAGLADYAPRVYGRLRRAPPTESAAGEEAEPGSPARGRPAPTRWPFLIGILEFPLYRGSRNRWLGLSLGALLVSYVVALAIKIGSVPAAGIAAVGHFMVCMLFSGTSFVLAAIWVAVASAYCLAIIRDTAEGNDQIVNWPDDMFLDWLGESFYVINSLVLCMLIGLTSAEAVDFSGVLGWLGPPICCFALFPLMLLSMLETDSPLRPFSLPVWQSLLWAWWGWALFYFEAAVLVVVLGRVAQEILVLGGLAAMPLAVAVLVAMLMIYARLLGRLAWYCGRGAKPRVQTGLEEDLPGGAHQEEQ